MFHDRPNLLILGGSEIAYQLAQKLQSLPVHVVSSLAGRTQNPRSPAGAWRVGGFGGIEGLVGFLRQNRINMMIDATHPFARTIQTNAQTAARIADVALLRLKPLPWQKTLGDRWCEVADEQGAAKILPKGATVFLALGRQRLGAFARRLDVTFVIRMLEQANHAASLPSSLSHCKIIFGAPSRQDIEARLFQAHKIDILVSRNSGAQASYAKIAAARDLSLPVVMIVPPVPPANIPTVHNVQAAQDFIIKQIGKDISAQ